MGIGRDGWLWTVGLVSAGLLLLAWNLGFFAIYEPWPQYCFATGLAGAGISFFVGYVRMPSQWWRLIPGWTMVALALMLLLSMLPVPPIRLIAALLFWGMALAFAQIYWRQRIDQWWAIIPGGFMLVLGATIAVSGIIADIELLGAFMFVGMGGVFYLLYALNRHARQWWALIPASVLFLFGIFVAVARRTAEGELDGGIVRWWPLFVILAGLFVGWRTYRTPTPSPVAAKPLRFDNPLRRAKKPLVAPQTAPLDEEHQPANRPEQRG